MGHADSFYVCAWARHLICQQQASRSSQIQPSRLLAREAAGVVDPISRNMIWPKKSGTSRQLSSAGSWNLSTECTAFSLFEFYVPLMAARRHGAASCRKPHLASINGSHRLVNITLVISLFPAAANGQSGAAGINTSCRCLSLALSTRTLLVGVVGVGLG